MWDINTLQNKHEFIKQAVVINNMIITSSFDTNYLYVWDLNTGDHIQDIDIGSYPYSLLKLSDTKILAYNTVQIRDMITQNIKSLNITGVSHVVINTSIITVKLLAYLTYTEIC